MTHVLLIPPDMFLIFYPSLFLQICRGQMIQQCVTFHTLTGWRSPVCECVYLCNPYCIYF